MGRNWAIAIGINNYENLSALKYAKQDAEVMADWFGQEAQFDEVFLFTEDSPPIDKTNPPVPTSPTYGHLRRFLRAQFEDIEQPLLKSGDNLWFFFAGHGLRYRDKDYLMLCDSDPGDIEHTAIAVEYVTQRLRRSGADNVVLFLDACRDQGSRGGVGIGSEKHQGVITFYSCTANQKSWEFDELQHGSFTYALLEGLRIQGETNCATVERLNQHLRYSVPQLNTRYGKGAQNPYLKAEPPYKMYFILQEQSATLKDVEPLKYQASLAENKNDLLLSEQLWIRVLAVSRGDLDAIRAIQRIAVKQTSQAQNVPQEPVVTTSEPANLPRGTEVKTSETDIQKQEQHQQNLEQYRQNFSKAVEQECPLGESSRKELRNLQQSLQLSDEEISQIEQPIIAQKEVEERKRQEEERIRQQQEAEILQRQREETERLRQQEEAKYQQKQEEAERIQQQREIQRRRRQQETITTSVPITRQQFLKWAVWGSAGLVTAIIVPEVFKDPPPRITVAEPKYIPPTEGASKVLGSSLWTVEFETVTVDRKGEVVKRNVNNQAKFFKEDLGNDVILEMVSIPGGKFMMGLPEGEGQGREKPQHEVTVQPFFMGKFQITQAQWKAISSLPKIEKDLDLAPSSFKGDDLPVEQVSWEDVNEFCQRLSAKTGKEYRLPTEAEWEYACRSVNSKDFIVEEWNEKYHQPFHFGATIISNLANYDPRNIYANEPKGEYRGKTTSVGSFPPNAFGLYDMHGNVWEWCQDKWHGNYEGAPNDGSAWLSGESSYNVRRGGSWFDSPFICRSAFRSFFIRGDRYSLIGFRVVCVAPRTT